MDGETLYRAMKYPGYPAPFSVAYYEKLAEDVNAALFAAKCNTVERASGFLSQIGAESGSLRWMEELASGDAYNWRSDLGNTEPGDGPRFKGRGPIQLTGRTNYGLFGAWMHKHGRVGSANYFLDHPHTVAHPKYAFMSAVFYWMGQHPYGGYRNLNHAADITKTNSVHGRNSQDVTKANFVMTHMVNGGTMDLDGRLARFKKCLSLEEAILPNKGVKK